MSTQTKYNFKPNQGPGAQGKGTPRDKKGRAYYLSRLPFYKKYPRAVIFTGAIFCAFLPFSKPFYHAMFTRPEDIKYQDDWWPTEKLTGKRIIDMHRERYARQLEEAEKIKLAQAAKVTAALAAKAAADAAKLQKS